jgi:hypothetical protein
MFVCNEPLSDVPSFSDDTGSSFARGSDKDDTAAAEEDLRIKHRRGMSERLSYIYLQ